jgi:hypothetical protein
MHLNVVVMVRSGKGCHLIDAAFMTTCSLLLGLSQKLNCDFLRPVARGVSRERRRLQFMVRELAHIFLGKKILTMECLCWSCQSGCWSPITCLIRVFLPEQKLTTGAGAPLFFSIQPLTGTSSATPCRIANSALTLKDVATKNTPYFSVEQTVGKEPVLVDKVPLERPLPRPSIYAALQVALKPRKASKYYDGIDGACGALLAPPSVSFTLISFTPVLTSGSHSLPVTDNLRRHLDIDLLPFSGWKCEHLSEKDDNPAPSIQTP